MLDATDAARLELGVGRRDVTAAKGDTEVKRWVGTRMLRVEDAPLLKGRGGFVDDLPV
jgi:hypothetical protein